MHAWVQFPAQRRRKERSAIWCAAEWMSKMRTDAHRSWNEEVGASLLTAVLAGNGDWITMDGE
jgi:hypothetical protein